MTRYLIRAAGQNSFGLTIKADHYTRDGYWTVFADAEGQTVAEFNHSTLQSVELIGASKLDDAAATFAEAVVRYEVALARIPGDPQERDDAIEALDAARAALLMAARRH